MPVLGLSRPDLCEAGAGLNPLCDQAATTFDGLAGLAM